jgi:phospholipase/carboxylesterase
MDDVVPPSSMPEAAEALGAEGFEVFAHVSRGTAHGIAPDGLGVALAFLRERLGLEDMDPG